MKLPNLRIYPHFPTASKVEKSSLSVYDCPNYLREPHILYHAPSNMCMFSLIAAGHYLQLCSIAGVLPVVLGWRSSTSSCTMSCSSHHPTKCAGTLKSYLVSSSQPHTTSITHPDEFTLQIALITISFSTPSQQLLRTQAARVSHFV